MTIEISSQVRREVERLGRRLRMKIELAGESIVAVARRLEIDESELEAMLAEGAGLTVNRLYATLSALDLSAEGFLREIYLPLERIPVVDAEEGAPAPEERARHLAAALVVEIEGAGRSPEELGRALGLAASELPQVLSGAAPFYCWQLFAVLEELQVPPTDFFVTHCDLLGNSDWDDTLALLPQLLADHGGPDGEPVADEGRDDDDD